ncbi:MAG TPA: response regulator [Candidatus Hydrogenedentes bacterium]|nr:response regulator [Candidatus Hydrogenedentota bacterium]
MENESPVTALIVDDEPDLCEMLVFEFSARGYRVFSASDGQEAERILDHEDVALLLTDVRMPLCDGLELLSWVKTRNVYRPTVILISAYADITVEEAHDLGAEVVLTKPFRLSELADIVTRILLPPERRWCTPPVPAPVRACALHFSSFESARKEAVFDLGRGGAAFAFSGSTLSKGENIRIEVCFDEGPFPSLHGTGIVNWVRSGAEPKQLQKAGLEFTWLSEETRTAFLLWHSTHAQKPYIPSLKPQ